MEGKRKKRKREGKKSHLTEGRAKQGKKRKGCLKSTAFFDQKCVNPAYLKRIRMLLKTSQSREEYIFPFPHSERKGVEGEGMGRGRGKKWKGKGMERGEV